MKIRYIVSFIIVCFFLEYSVAAEQVLSDVKNITEAGIDGTSQDSTVVNKLNIYLQNSDSDNYVDFNGKKCTDHIFAKVSNNQEVVLNIFHYKTSEIDYILLNNKDITDQYSNGVLRFMSLSNVDNEVDIKFRTKPVKLKILTLGEDVSVAHFVNKGANITFQILSDKDKLHKVTLDGVDVTYSVVDGYLTVKRILNDKSVVVSLEKPTSTEIIHSGLKNIRAWTMNNKIFIEADDPIESIQVFDLSGVQRYSSKQKSNSVILCRDFTGYAIVRICINGNYQTIKI